jgi:hypothetical protein
MDLRLTSNAAAAAKIGNPKTAFGVSSPKLSMA